MHQDNIWEKVRNIPDDKLWNAHMDRKEKLMKVVKENVTRRLKRNGMNYEEINEITSKLNPNALTIGFARRFATYKRATLIFKDIARLTQILCDENRPVQLVFAGKAHPADKEGQELIKTIHEVSLMPQFKGKIFLLENYNIAIARYLVSGVDVWLNNPRRPMEASGTSGEKASVNGVLNFSILDGWWAEGYDGSNGWSIGTNAEYTNEEEQDKTDSNSIYHTLENKIIPVYYNKDRNGISKDWIRLMKNSIKSTAGKYSTSRMVVDYVNELYMPLANLSKKYYSDLSNVISFTNWKKNVRSNWNTIKIEQKENIDNVRMVAGSKVKVRCLVSMQNINKEDANVQVYFGQFLENGNVKNVYTREMKCKAEDGEILEYEGEIDLSTGGNFGYTFRVMPKHEMLLDSENMNLIKWLTK